MCFFFGGGGDRLPTPIFLGFPGGSGGKESTCNARDLSLIPELGRSPRERNSYPLQYSGLENSMGRGAWWATAHGVTEELDRTLRLKNNKEFIREFTGGAVVKTLHFHCWGPGFDPWLGN